MIKIPLPQKNLPAKPDYRKRFLWALPAVSVFFMFFWIVEEDFPTDIFGVLMLVIFFTLIFTFTYIFKSNVGGKEKMVFHYFSQKKDPDKFLWESKAKNFHPHLKDFLNRKFVSNGTAVSEFVFQPEKDQFLKFFSCTDQINYVYNFWVFGYFHKQIKSNLYMRQRLDWLTYQYLQVSNLIDSPKSGCIGEKAFDSKVEVYAEDFSRSVFKQDLDIIGKEKILRFLDHRITPKNMMGNGAVFLQDGWVYWIKIKDKKSFIRLKEEDYKIENSAITIPSEKAAQLEKQYHQVLSKLETELQEFGFSESKDLRALTEHWK